MTKCLDQLRCIWGTVRFDGIINNSSVTARVKDESTCYFQSNDFVRIFVTEELKENFIYTLNRHIVSVTLFLIR